MWRTVITLFLLTSLPGSLIYRLPLGQRTYRASLPFEERAFWYIFLGIAWSSVVGLSLAAAGGFSFERLLWANGAACGVLLLVLRRNVRLASPPRPSWSALLPTALAAAAFLINFHVPPSEYIIGGRDPGVYINEGVQIAQRGSLTPTDRVAASVPEDYRDLFFPQSAGGVDFRSRFMGFFVLDPSSGAVVGQFPHLYPAWLAVGYGVNGLTGVRSVHGFAAILGVLAVYFAGARLFGRAAAAAGAALLALNVIQLWYARYPNAEIVMQPLVFAGLLAYVRAQFDGDRFFAPVAAVLFCLALFAHLTAAVVIAAVGAAALVEMFQGRRPAPGFAVPLAAGTALGAAYLMTVLPPYFLVPLGFVRNLQPVHLAALGIAGAFVLAIMSRKTLAVQVGRWIPVAIVIALWLSAIYAYFIRAAGGRLAPHDADALRTFTSFYLTPAGLAAALAGLVVVRRRTASNGVSFLFVAALMAFFFFYKIRIVPEHFWATRRFLAVILPSMLLLAGAAAFSPEPLPARFRAARYAIGAVLVTFLGWHFLGASRAILQHVEYAGVIPRIEALAGAFGADDLVVVESRNASDVHVLALPLAYIYDRNVLVLASTAPDKRAFRQFLEWARTRYARVFFIGAGGTELLSRHTAVRSIRNERFLVPEHESAWNRYPRHVRFKEFNLGIYEFAGETAPLSAFTLDVGAADDLYVRRVHAKERHQNESTFRWTRDVSYASIFASDPNQRQLTLWLDSGGRPPSTGKADVEVFLNDERLGQVTVESAAPYRFTIPAPLAAAMAASEDAAQLRIVSRTWNPSRVLGGPDDRDLGVMLDRIELR